MAIRIGPVLALLLLSRVCSGCTLLVRLDHSIQEGGLYAHPYTGVIADATVIYSGDGVQSSGTGWRVMALLDLPLSAVLDTILVPMDVALWIVRDAPVVRPVVPKRGADGVVTSSSDRG